MSKLKQKTVQQFLDTESQTIFTGQLEVVFAIGQCACWFPTTLRLGFHSGADCEEISSSIIGRKDCWTQTALTCPDSIFVAVTWLPISKYGALHLDQVCFETLIL